MSVQHDLTLNTAVYDWSVRAFTWVRRLLKVNIRLHHSDGQLEAGDIFLFNHFARFESFIPQYLLHRETGAYCRSVADHTLFSGNDAFSQYLLSIGGVPNRQPGLLPFLAAEVLRGRKIVIFPEGGMVKDRCILDAAGQYSVYSRTAAARRKHHSGAAVLAMAVEVFKRAVRRAEAEQHWSRLDHWAETLQLPDRATLLKTAHRPTLIVPANITFYPLRVSDNALQRGVELFYRSLSRRSREELLIESNILLRDTDMDIRIGEAIRAADGWSWWERQIVDRLAAQLETLDQAFANRARAAGLGGRLYAHVSRRNTARIRDAWTAAMYRQVTVNLSHLASLALLALLDADQVRVSAARLHRLLYLAVKQVQRLPAIPLHDSLREPDAYESLLDGRCGGFEQFLAALLKLRLITRVGDDYCLLPRLRTVGDFDAIRLENPVRVYANEVRPLAAVQQAVLTALAEVDKLNPRTLALLRFDDEQHRLACDRRAYNRPSHQAINRLSTITADPQPFFLRPPRPQSVGVLLVHGLLASPAEMRGFGDRLHGLGYPALGVRLRGHGTSPWDLYERQYDDWLTSVRRGYKLLAPFVEQVCIVGFSTGGTLALRLAAEQPAGLAGVVALAPALRLCDRKIMLVPLAQSVNRYVRCLPFCPNQPENPHINYAHMPLPALHQLCRLMADCEQRLDAVQCPVLLMQATADPVVSGASLDTVRARLGSRQVQEQRIAAAQHGILYANTGGTQERVLDFLQELPAACRRESGSPQHRAAQEPRLALSSIQASTG